MENMTLEQLIATFGPEVGKQMFEQMSAASGGGNRAPFTYLKKVSTHGSELGAFGDFVYGVETEKQADGTRAVTDTGTNLGTSFEFIIVNVAYRYRKWDAAANNGKGRNLQSNIFTDLKQINTPGGVVDVFSGKPLPKTKEEKKEADWSLVRINTGLVRADAKSPWVPVIFETSGSLYFTLGNVIGNQLHGGLLSGIAKLTMKLASKGSTQFSVVNEEKSSFEPLPKDFWTDDNIKAMLSDITLKMADYASQGQYTGSAAAATTGTTTPASDTQDESNW
jgi:hypothetical protein